DHADRPDAPLGQLGGDGQADPAAGPGDDGDLVLNVHGSFLSVRGGLPGPGPPPRPGPSGGGRSAAPPAASGRKSLGALLVTARRMWPASSVIRLTSVEPTYGRTPSVCSGGTRWSALAVRSISGQVIRSSRTGSSPMPIRYSPLTSSLRW